MPKMEYSASGQAKLLAAIEKLLEDLIAQGDNMNDVSERIQQQLGAINNDNNLEPGERLA